MSVSILRLLIAASLVLVIVVMPASAKKMSFSRGCNHGTVVQNKACQARVCKASCRHRLARKALRARAASVSGLARCIAHFESTDNPQATNGSHSGLGQWTAEAWARHGGLRFASSPTGATYDQQLIVIEQGLQRYGCRDWCPFDPAPEAC